MPTISRRAAALHEETPRDILRSCDELSIILHDLELHVAPADVTGKRLLAIARDRLAAISSAAQHDSGETGTAQGG